MSTHITWTPTADQQDIITASYTARIPGMGKVVLTPQIKRRARRGRTWTVITRLHPLLARELTALSAYERPHVEMLLYGASIVLNDQVVDGPDHGLVATRDRGRLVTTYQGHPALTRDQVLDLAEYLRFRLHGGPRPEAGAASVVPAPVEEDLWPRDATRPRGRTTRADLCRAIALFLDQGPNRGIDPDDVAAAVVARYGLTAWEDLDREQVSVVLADADTRIQHEGGHGARAALPGPAGEKRSSRPPKNYTHNSTLM